MFEIKDMDNLYKEGVVLDADDFFNRADIICEQKELDSKMSLMMDSVAYDSYTLAKYNALNFEEYKNYLVSNDLLKSTNSDVKRVNLWLVEELSKSYNTIMNALAFRNIAFAMRIMRKSFSLILKSIYLNLRDDDDNYLTIDSFKMFCTEDFIDSSIDCFNSDSLEWTKPAIEFLNGKSNIYKETQFDYISLDMLAQLLNLFDIKLALLNTEQYINHSISELFANTKNPTIEYYFLPDEENFNYLGEVEREYMDNSIINEFYVFQSLNCLIESSIEVLYALGINQNEMDPFIHYLDFILSYGEDDEEDDDYLDESVEDEATDDSSMYDEGFISTNEMEYPFDVRYNDPAFYDVLNDNSTKSIDDFTYYFDNYKNNFFVVSDVVIQDEKIFQNSTKLAFKYLNLFRSLLVGFRFSRVNFNPRRVLIKDSIFSNMVDDKYNNKLLFDSTEFERMALDEDENSSNILLITVIQDMVNICNSIISNDVSSSLNEINSLRNITVIKSFINVMGESCLNKFLDESFFLSQKNLQKLKITEKIIDTLDEEDTLSLHKEKLLFNSFEESEGINISDYPSVFDFTSNKINGINGMIEYIKNKTGIDLEILDLRKIKEFYALLNNPFDNKTSEIDLNLSMIVLNCAQLVVNSLESEPLYKDNLKAKEVSKICNQLIKKDFATYCL
jgi:hypothetical protein